MSSYLITGCSRGLGLELVKQLLSAQPSDVGTILATSRSASPSAALEEHIQKSKGRLHYIQLDVVSKHSIDSAFEHASQILDGRGLDVLINNAGALAYEPGGASAMHALESLLNLNVISVHNVSRAFLPLLEQGKEQKLVNITSTAGAFGYNDFTKMMPVHSYRISKAALNMLTLEWSNDLGPKGFTVFCVSPGWLRTDLGGEKADLAPDVGAKATMDIIYKATPKDNGAFRNIFVEGTQLYDGKNPPW